MPKEAESHNYYIYITLTYRMNPVKDHLVSPVILPMKYDAFSPSSRPMSNFGIWIALTPGKKRNKIIILIKEADYKKVDDLTR